jgi:multidrug efflux pump subunit AcrA (membrane-fusion protein)
MTSPPETIPAPLAALPRLSAHALGLRRERELFFSIANDTRALARYRTLLLFAARRRGAMRLVAVSGLSAVEANGAYTLWAQKVAAALVRALQARQHLDLRASDGSGPAAAPAGAALHTFTAADVDADLATAWAEYWPVQVGAFVLDNGAGQPLGLAVHLLDHPMPEPMVPLLQTLHHVHGAALGRLRSARWRLLGSGSGLGWAITGLVVAAAAAAMWLVPVRQFVVAPAEIVSLDTVAITAPLDGVVGQLVAKPNQAVRRGDELFRLDDTTLRNRLSSAQEALEVARSDFLAGSHRALLMSAGNASGPGSVEVGVLRGRIQERLAEVRYLEEQRDLLVVRAPREGIAVYGQENDWIGKPVSAGQRVMDLADAMQPGVLVWLPVSDAIQMQPGAPMQVVLQADPLRPWTATLEQASYQPVRSPDGVASYRLRATLPAGSQVRLGLRGSARLDGEEVSLGYFLLRRPITAARQWLGL